MKAFNTTAESGFNIINSDEDAEIQREPKVISHKQEVQTATPFSDRFCGFSSCNKLVQTIARYKNLVCRKRKNGNSDHLFDEHQRLKENE